MAFDYAPASNLTTIDAGRPIASPVSGASPITVEVPRTAPASNSSPPFWRTATRNGPGGIDAQVFTQNGAADIGSTYYEPVTGDLSARPRPSTNPRLNPVNAGNTATTQARAATPSAPVNPRIPRITPSTLARGGLSVGVGLAVEMAAQAAFNAAFPGAAERARAYDARNADPRSATPTSGEISAGIGALGAGAIGAAAVGAAIAARYGLPDDVDAGNPRGLLGRILGWDEDYPNALDPDGMDGGPLLDPGSSASGGLGQSSTSYYCRVLWTFIADPNTRRLTGVDTYIPLGPISGISRANHPTLGSHWAVYHAPVPANQIPSPSTGGQNYRFVQPLLFADNALNPELTNIRRVDGQTDPPYQPAQPATYAPNPARPPRTDDGEPPALPAPPLPAPPAPAPWPGVAPQRPPDTAPLAPPPAAPAPFEPTAPQGEPNTPTNPDAPPGPPDLDPDAPPRETPPDLGTDPDTPPTEAPIDRPAAGSTVRIFHPKIFPPRVATSRTSETPTTVEEINAPETPKGADEDSPWWNVPVLPVPVPVGKVAPATTPSPPSLVPRTPTNPNIVETPPPVIQTPPEGPKGSCFYEFQRVADIQRRAADTQQRASNPVSGFPGLYGLAIESRTKLGQTYDNTQQTKERIRPEDFPLLLPDQIAKAHPGQVRIHSLAELGVWIVKQLDGVVGKWPMEVPVPGASQALAVPNMSEAIAEMFGMMISQQVTAAQILNTSSRTLAQAGSATQQAALANMIAKGNAEFLGYQSRPSAVDMPLTYSPGKDPGEGLLEESTAKIQGWENTDNTDLKQILSDLLHAAQIIKAVYWRRLDPRQDFEQQIDDQIRGKGDWADHLGANPGEAQKESWEQYLKDVEAGFKELSKAEAPYNRPEEEGPQIRDITPDPDTEAP